MEAIPEMFEEAVLKELRKLPEKGPENSTFIEILIDKNKRILAHQLSKHKDMFLDNRLSTPPEHCRLFTCAYRKIKRQ